MSLYVPAFEYRATLRLQNHDLETVKAVIAALRRLPGVRYCAVAAASSAMRQMYQLHLVINGYQPPTKDALTARVQAATDLIEKVWPQAYFSYRYGPADTPAPELP